MPNASSTPNLHQARRYIRRIKHELGPTSPRYRAFLNLLRVYGASSSSSSSRELIERVRDLLRGHEGLLDGFRVYLPEGYDDDHDDGGEEEQTPAASRHRVATTSDVIMSWRESCADLLNIEEITERLHLEFTTCKFCNGNRNAVAIKNNEPILLCELKGCNREYHLRCLPRGLIDKGVNSNAENTEGRNDDIVKYVLNDMEEAEVTEGGGADDIPPGEIYCQQCAADGSTSVLRQYFDRCDAIRSNFSCSRAYVMSLLEKHMRENPMGNAIDPASGSNDADDDEGDSTKTHLKPPPRSELWSVEEMNRMALASLEGDDNNSVEDGTRSSKDSWKAAEFLVGKPVRLYCNLDNEYHNGRIVDWRTCSVYPNVAGVQKTSKNRDINDLDYYGIGPISTFEFLVRFPSGSEGRKKDLLQWMLLEEHSLAVGITLVRGKIRSPKTRVWGWKPAMILARSALELVPVREFLCEGKNGELFQNMEKDGKKQLRAGVSRDLWALTSFFGGDNFAVLNLRDEVQALITKDLLENDDLKDGISGAAVGDKEAQEPKKQRASTSPSGKSAIQSESGLAKNKLAPIKQHPCSSIPVKLGLALVEYNEQRRCRDWYRTILRDPMHPMALTSVDEHSLDMATDGIVDRLHVADLADKASPPVERSRDCLMSFDSKPVTTVSGRKPSVEDKDMSEADAEMVEDNKHEDANTITEERSKSFDNEQGDVDEDEDDDLDLGDDIEEEYDEGIYADYDVVESFEDDESVTSDDMMSVESSTDKSEVDDLSELGMDRKPVATKRKGVKVVRTGKPGRPRHALQTLRSTSEYDAGLGIRKGQTIVRGKKVTVDVVRTGSRGRPRHVNVTTGSEIAEDDTKIEGLKKPLQQPKPTPKPELQTSPIEAKKPSPKPPPPKPKAAKPKPKPAKPVEETGDEEDSDVIDIPRGITMRPSGKWVRNVCFRVFIDYVGSWDLILVQFSFNIPCLMLS
ncbi:hypothetical protein HJC23_000891 [Cyclotella cryptica]|uniref:Zinc finger PHD-type domain-containing protein n=1 Tax=Cyclotella cryptica TaxID=29204 RepID=A0ABD3PT81_9STRA